MRKDIIEKHNYQTCMNNNLSYSCSADRLKAIKQANKIRSELKSKNWSVRVWENLGWHWELNNEYMTLLTNYDNKYQAELKLPLVTGNTVIQFFSEYYKNPNKAIDGVYAISNNFKNKLEKCLNKQYVKLNTSKRR